MKSTEVNKVYELGNGNYCIKEAGSTNCYLLVGERKALLFDTGYGYENIQGIIESITDLPLIVVNSHGDPDHALGNCRFNEVYIHELDLGKLFRNDNPQMKKVALDYRLKKLPELKNHIDYEAYLNTTVKNVNYKFVKEGDRFDLGGKVLEVIHLPGHSYGCIALLDTVNKDLFSGDMVTRYNIWYFALSNEQAPFSMAKASYKKLQQRKDEILNIYPAHGAIPIDNSVIDDLLASLEDMKINSANDRYFQSFAGNGYEHHYKDTLIIYSRSRLQEFIEQDEK
ncbi:MBL fold metallo-hydrolase [Bacillus sp. FJAT-50079]|uniref:MBL fold metallo-hydrolase n=1 Tax=Bacillus sp. FJAT-50079 TaxID=2833577 RepID=UPI001BC9D3A5|nr:MBL fold metallo-hydrolase [Bacillus sp. FJAT-50079]MBS4207110.1 MBL fold metallo-hydrolase [Bacillus sp. FJAT-50079]